MSDLNFQINAPDSGFVDEEGLLPGHHDLLNTFGDLNLGAAALAQATLSFAPLVDQQSLLDLNLTSQGSDLYYTLNADKTVLSAYQGANGPLVFEAQLYEDGSYGFQLQAPLDRPPPENLIHDPSFYELDHNLIPQFGSHSSWQQHDNDIVSLQDLHATHEVFVTQTISSDPSDTYVLSFGFGDNQHQASRVELYWNDKLIQTLSGEQAWKGYSFTVEGAASGESELKLIGYELNQPLSHYFKDLHLTSTTTQKLPIDFVFQVSEQDEVVLNNHFTVNVTNDPDLIVPNQPYEIVYDQAAFQSIILNEASLSDNPLTTLNLDALFKQLKIEEGNRQVDVVQLEENGQGSHVYEVHIVDKANPDVPINIADVHLMFPGGEGGLDVFYKHIQILDT